MEQQSLVDIQIEGKLGEFIKVMQVLQDFSEVQLINIIQGSLKEFSDTKRFIYLSDGMTKRKYVIAEVKLFSNKTISLIEIERDNTAISTLIINLNYQEKYTYQQILEGLLDSNGTWNKQNLYFNNIKFLNLRHGKTDIEHSAKNVMKNKKSLKQG